MVCAANIILCVSWTLKERIGVGSHVAVMFQEELSRRGSPVIAECYIVTIPHSLHHLQLLLPISAHPPQPQPPTHKHPKRPVSTISALAQMKWIIGISQQRRRYERERGSKWAEKRKRIEQSYPKRLVLRLKVMLHSFWGQAAVETFVIRHFGGMSCKIK